MRIIANENVPGAIVERLRDARHDVSWVRADSPGATDQDVLQRAINEDRVILTFDKDFGELAFQGEDKAIPPGVILLRLHVGSPDELTRIVARAIAHDNDWIGQFSVVEEGRIRRRPLRRRL